MSKERKLCGIVNRFVVCIYITFAFAVAGVSCKSGDAEIEQSRRKPVAMVIQGQNAKVLTFSNWSFERMNGSNPVFAGKITYDGGTLTEVNAFCLQDGMKSTAYLIFNPNLKPGESAKGELHCAQITTPPEKIIIEVN